MGNIFLIKMTAESLGSYQIIFRGNGIMELSVPPDVRECVIFCKMGLHPRLVSSYQAIITEYLRKEGERAILSSLMEYMAERLEAFRGITKKYITLSARDIDACLSSIDERLMRTHDAFVLPLAIRKPSHKQEGFVLYPEALSLGTFNQRSYHLVSSENFTLMTDEIEGMKKVIEELTKAKIGHEAQNAKLERAVAYIRREIS